MKKYRIKEETRYDGKIRYTLQVSLIGANLTGWVDLSKPKKTLKKAEKVFEKEVKCVNYYNRHQENCNENQINANDEILNNLTFNYQELKKSFIEGFSKSCEMLDESMYEFNFAKAEEFFEKWFIDYIYPQRQREWMSKSI